VVRNRIRRQVRETFRQRRAKLAELDVVVMARPGAATVPARVLADSLSNFFDRMAQACDASQSH
jgi:ribonuclease P protein component